MLHDPRHQGHLQMVAVRFHQSQVNYSNHKWVDLKWSINKISHLSNIGADEMLYTETDLENSMSKIDTINFHQEIDFEGIKFWCYHGIIVFHLVLFLLFNRLGLKLAMCWALLCS